MSHMLTVLRAYNEAEGLAWSLYVRAYREKMAATGKKLCVCVCVGGGGYGRGTVPRVLWTQPRGETRQGGDRKRRICWSFNDGACTWGPACKFAHICELCRGDHPKSRWSAGGRSVKRPKNVVLMDCCDYSLSGFIVGVFTCS